MERVVYEQMAELDDRHWWYRARREVLAALIRRLAKPPAAAKLLEIGCGTGHNLPMLAEFGDVDALELDDQARELAQRRAGRAIMSSPLPELEDVKPHAYDLIGAFDVIEHIDDDIASVASIASRLKPGGKFVMTVPAHQWMWSAHDLVSHHKRRYSKQSLKMLIDASPLKLQSIGYLNSLLFPAAVVERLSSKRSGKDYVDLWLPPRPVNAALEAIFASERHLIGRVPLPPGLSLFAVATA